MNKRFAWPLMVVMLMIVFFNLFITFTDFGPKVALACDSRGDLRCNDIIGCTGSAGCNGKGSVESSCILRCQDGTRVLCNFE
ncbi:MAG: hypothetical protein ONB37_08270 [candidate division KSB1 bacterium]|nr:hypothetical protein [candidate division KSB1 bacterium]